MEIRLVPSDQVFAFRGEWWDLLGERRYHDMVLHAVAVINHSSRIVAVESVAIQAIVEGRVIQSQVYDQADIERLTKPLLDRVQLGLRRLIDLMLWVDHAVPARVELSPSLQLNPHAALVTTNIYLACPRLPELLKIVVKTRDEVGSVDAEVSLRVTEYASRVKYAFPLEGAWFMKASPNTGVLDHHRFGTSSEFAVDLMRLGPGGELFKGDGKLAGDYYSFGERVLAAADGKVVAVSKNSIQEWARFNPVEGETMEQFRERELDEIRKALEGDIVRWAAGNYVIIEHAGGEYSSYLHLREGSVRVKVGDAVRCGQHIADVGNTGDSYGAHLHFQVTDSPDLAQGRSLPFTFDNIETELMEPGRIVRAKK